MTANTGTVTNPIVQAAVCGNGKIEGPGEECEPGMVNTTCPILMGPTYTGLVMCMQCKYDVSTCTAMTTSVPLGGTGTGGTGPTGGAGH